MLNYNLELAQETSKKYLKYINIHPKQLKVGDCVKRALALGSDTPYREMSIYLNRYKKISGAKEFNEKKNWQPFVEKILCGEKISFPAVTGMPRMYSEKFCEKYPKGIYILNMAGHLSVCINGVVYDSWDCTEKCIYNVWKINRLLCKTNFNKLK